jgi:hypothetical protein
MQKRLEVYRIDMKYIRNLHNAELIQKSVNMIILTPKRKKNC